MVSDNFCGSDESAHATRETRSCLPAFNFLGLGFSGVPSKPQYRRAKIAPSYQPSSDTASEFFHALGELCNFVLLEDERG